MHLRSLNGAIANAKHYCANAIAIPGMISLDP